MRYNNHTFALNDKEEAKLQTALSSGYSIIAIIRLGLEAALKSSQKTQITRKETK